MVVKNLQTLAVCVANVNVNDNVGVRVTGLVCGSMPAKEFQAQILSLPWQPLPGYPIRTGPDAERFADNAATARAVHRTGRSVSGVGNLPSARLARGASRTVLSTRSSHALAKRMMLEQG
jgi:hypothetical protein